MLKRLYGCLNNPRWLLVLCGVILALPALQLHWLGQSLRAGELLGAWGMQACIVLLPLALFGSWRAWLLLWLPAATGIPIYLLVCHAYRSVPGDVLVSAALTTDWQNSWQLIKGSAAGLLWIPLVWLVMGWTWLRARFLRPLSKPVRQALLAVLLVYAAAGMLGRQDLARWVSLPPLFEEHTAALVYPVNLVLSVKRTLNHRQALAVGESVQGRARPDGGEPMLVVLVIGESVRPDHLGIYGYPRQTTPWLSAHRDEWLWFTDVRSTAQWTAVAVPQLMTHATPAGRRASLVQTFREAGYQTAWFSNQEKTPLSRAADVVEHPEHEVELYFRKDDAMLPAFEAFVRQGRDRQMAVLHMHGSHFPYADRYHRRFRQFVPTLADVGVDDRPGPQHKQAAINDYDNTLLALDDFLARLQALIAGERRPVVLVFTSDHGENLFDDGRQRFMHAHPDASKWDLEVPLLFWANSAFRQGRNGAWQALESHRAVSVGHTDLFATILDLGAVEWRGQNLHASLASQGFVSSPRRRYELGGKDVGDADSVH